MTQQIIQERLTQEQQECIVRWYQNTCTHREDMPIDAIDLFLATYAGEGWEEEQR
jgi:hypothetical protein